MPAALAGDWGAGDEDDLVLGRIALALDRVAGHYGPLASRLVAAARDGTTHLLGAMDLASLDGWVGPATLRHCQEPLLTLHAVLCATDPTSCATSSSALTSTGSMRQSRRSDWR